MNPNLPTRKGWLAGALLLAAGSLAHGQQAPTPVKAVEIKFGKPDPADFETKNFVGDSAAAAVVLYDGGKASFRLEGTSFKLETERTTRLKILKKAGYEYATVEIPLYHRDSDEEKIVGLKGFTYNEVGGKIEKVKLEAASLFTEERTKNVRVRKLTLPSVREGSVVEYSYTVVSDFLFNLQPWAFQRDIPTRWSEYWAVIPEYFDYKMLMQGYEPLALQTREEVSAQYLASMQVDRVDGITYSGTATTHSSRATEAIQARATSYHWAMRDVPALREEPYMTTTDDYVARIDFELAGTRMPNSGYRNVAGNWLKLNEEMMESEEFGLLLDRGGFLKEQVLPLVAQYPDPATRAAAVRALVLRAVKHDGTSRRLASGSLKHTWEQHRGNSADVNLLLIAALRQAGLATQPVLLSTRAHGRVSQEYPQLDQFNYVLALVERPGAPDLLLDATEPMLPAETLPLRCLNKIGHTVPAEGEGRWVSLTPTQRRNRYQRVTMTLDEQGNLSSEVQEEHSGYAALEAREKLAGLGEKKYVAEMLGPHATWEVPAYQFAAVADCQKPLELHYSLRQPATTPGPAQELYLSPLAAFGEGSNPFRLAERRFPVDFGMPQQEMILLTLKLPAGYVAELPKAASLALPDQGGRYMYAASSPAPGTVQLVSRLTLDKPVYSPEEYHALRELYRQMLAKQAEAIVVKKAGS